MRQSYSPIVRNIVSMKKFICFCFVLFAWSQGISQLEETYNDNRNYIEDIGSVQFYSHSADSIREQDYLNPAVIGLGSSQKLRLEFDDRKGGFTNLLYRIVHCDKDWYFSNLNEIEYLEGFNDEEIDNFGYSTNTYSEYTHYSLSLPNDDIRWLISGNYMLFIYEEDTLLPVLSRRFIVVEPSVNLRGTISKPQDISNVRSHHELKLSLNHDNFDINLPLNEIYLTVMQNGNTNSAYHNIQGTFTRGNNVHFEAYSLQLVFPALKEFRSCDIRSLKYRSEFVHSIDQNDYNTNVLMDLDKKRADKHFYTEPDANGGFVIENRDFRFGEVSSEYANVTFSLEAPLPYSEDVYIVGALSNWEAEEKFRMDYDAERGLYTKDVELKQGFYDYMYALLKDDGILAIEDIEGSWYETDNEYQVIVYYRENGSEYDRVLDVGVIKYQF